MLQAEYYLHDLRKWATNINNSISSCSLLPTDGSAAISNCRSKSSSNSALCVLDYVCYHARKRRRVCLSTEKENYVAGELLVNFSSDSLITELQRLSGEFVGCDVSDVQDERINTVVHNYSPVFLYN